MKKLIAVLLSTVLLLSLIVGCSSSTPASEESKLTDFDVILDWYPNAFHAYLYTALEKGYFEEAGLNVKLIPPAGYSDGITFPAAGRAKIGLYYMDDIITGYADQGLNIQVIGACTQESLNVVAMLKSSGIESPADLKGKTVGYSGSPSLRAKIMTLCKNAGLTEDDITLVDVGFDLITAITTGNVDVIAGGMINAEIIELQDAGYDIAYWTWDDYGVPREYNTLMIANKDDYETNKDLYDAFMAACRKGFEDVKNDPEAAIDIIMNHEDAENYALDRELETKSLAALIDIENNSGVEFGSMSEEVWDTVIKWAYDNDLCENMVRARDFVVIG